MLRDHTGALGMFSAKLGTFSVDSNGTVIFAGRIAAPGLSAGAIETNNLAVAGAIAAQSIGAGTIQAAVYLDGNNHVLAGGQRTGP